MKQERLFKEVKDHYDLAVEDLDARRPYMDKNDELFRTYLNETKWPYDALVADPRVFTAIIEKTSRLIGNNPTGRLIPRDGGDVIKAEIQNNLLQFQWQNHKKGTGRSMIESWSLMDMNTRRYGSSFALNLWMNKRPVKQTEDGKKRIEVFDGPTMMVLNNRDVLLNPSYSHIKNWFQYREFLTLKDLKDTIYASADKFIYKNLDKLEDALKKETESKGGGDKRDYTIKNKSIKGIQDMLGRDPYNKVMEIVTELREDRWIKFAPRYGVVIMDIPCPYDHYQIPVTHLRYYIVDDDIYGLSEIEPIEKLAKATNALVSQYLDVINTDLYPPLMIDPTQVQMHTIEYGSNKMWLMNKPGENVVKVPTGTASVQQFTSTYSFMVAAMQNALGSASLGISNVGDFQKDKTATEVQDLALTRNARDNYNKMFLAEAVNETMEQFLLLDRQFIFSDKTKTNMALRLTDRDTIKKLKEYGLDGYEVTPDGLGELANEQLETGETKYMEEAAMPKYPVTIDKDGEEIIVPKFSPDEQGEIATLYVEPEDFSGSYDFVIDIDSFGAKNDQKELYAKMKAIELIKDPAIMQMLMSDREKPKIKELMVKTLENMGFQDAEQYFEKVELPQGGMNGQPNQTGGATPPAMPMGQGNGAIQGMAGGSVTPPDSQGEQLLARPQRL